MILDERISFYDLLEIDPDASPQEIRLAYLRLKQAYSKSSPALYTLISQDETDDMLTQIEEAYDILSDPDKRRKYDQNHGLMEPSDQKALFGDKSEEQGDLLDQIPSTEMGLSGEVDLVAKPTDASGPAPNGVGIFDSTEAPLPIFQTTSPASMFEQPSDLAAISPQALQTPRRPKKKHYSSDTISDPEILREIESETDWHGSFLRRVREARNLSLEEMADFTKVTKTYLIAIENEEYERLPAAVYLRGFLVQIAKKLRLPHDKVASAYILRYRESRNND